jgi:pyruvate dehydrogenase (quinone)
VTHLFNGLIDARKEGAAIIAIAGDVETKLMDTAALEELNAYKFFDTACLYFGRGSTLKRREPHSRPQS